MNEAFDFESCGFVNSNVSWKKVAKGSRSLLRRPRNSVSTRLTACGEHVPGPVDASFSESEKLGISVLGHCFLDMAEHLPIKKRRSMLPLSSPTSSDSLFHKKLEAFDRINLEKNVLPCIDGKHEIDEFSGIRILAAAACGSFGGGDKCDVEGMDVLKHTVVDSMSMAALNVDSLPLASQCSEIDADALMSAQPPSPRCGRLHWDLNSPMDAWQHPIDNTIHACSQAQTDLPKEVEEVVKINEASEEIEKISASSDTGKLVSVENNALVSTQTKEHDDSEDDKSIDNVSLEVGLNELYSVASDDDREHPKTSRSEVDYDSQYEDGEFRESIQHTWEDYDCVDLEYDPANNSLDPGYEETVATHLPDIVQPCRSSSKCQDAGSEVENGDDMVCDGEEGQVRGGDRRSQVVSEKKDRAVNNCRGVSKWESRYDESFGRRRHALVPDRRRREGGDRVPYGRYYFPAESKSKQHRNVSSSCRRTYGGGSNGCFSSPPMNSFRSFSMRERSVSPVERRGHYPYFSRPKSPSRSRSHSLDSSNPNFRGFKSMPRWLSNREDRSNSSSSFRFKNKLHARSSSIGRSNQRFESSRCAGSARVLRPVNPARFEVEIDDHPGFRAHRGYRNANFNPSEQIYHDKSSFISEHGRRNSRVHHRADDPISYLPKKFRNDRGVIRIRG